MVVVMALIFTASSMSDPGAPPGGLSDKGAHVTAYAALGASLIRALAGGRSTAMTPRRILFAIVLATVYGLSDELHQSFVPERTPDVMDLAADAIGATAGALILTAAARGLSRLLRPHTGQ
ncbi:MAG: VanZ family protein [Burkholderiales bacterium]